MDTIQIQKYKLIECKKDEKNHVTSNYKKAGGPIVIYDEVYIKAKNVTREKKGILR